MLWQRVERHKEIGRTVNDSRQTLYGVLCKTNAIALATCVGNTPNVRVVNFCCDRSRPGILYFATDRDNGKVKEFAANSRVAFTTIPENGESVPHARSHDCIVRKSAFSLNELQELFIAKIPGYGETIDAIGESLDVYEIEIATATLVLSFEETTTVCFC